MSYSQLDDIRETLLKEREERRLVEKKHELQTAELNAVFQNLADAYIMMDLSGRVLKMNNPAKEILGYDIDIEKFNLMQIAVPNEAENIIKSFDILIKEGVLRNFKAFIKTKDGSLKYASVNASIIYDDSKNPVAAQGIVRDITDVYEEKNKLEESQERLYTLINNKGNGVMLANENCEILSINDNLFELFEIPINREMIIGHDSLKITQQTKNLFHNPDEYILDVVNIIKNRKLVKGDELKMKNGKILKRDFTPIFIDDIYKGYLWTYTDITLKKKYDKGIKAEKYKYESIINNTNLGLVEADAEGRIIAVNQKLLRMYGYFEEELVGKTIREIFPDEKIGLLLDTIRKDQLIEKSKPYEIPINTKSGDKRYWSISVAPNYNIEGQITSYIGTHMDITEAKELEFQKDSLLKKLKKTNKALQGYIHMVSHDLKSPLRNINALTLWLNEDYSTKFDKKGIDTINLIQSNVERMEKMTSGMLEYSSLDNDKVEMYDIDTNSLFNEIFSALIIPQHISITINNQLPIIKGDKFRLQLLFNNLLNNAIANIDKDEGIIEISCVEEKYYWKFCVKDNGKGIEKVYLEKIFNVFHKLDNKNNSTGIGLSIVRKIVEIYNGDIFAESEPGKGTEIHFTLEKF